VVKSPLSTLRCECRAAETNTGGQSIEGNICLEVPGCIGTRFQADRPGSGVFVQGQNGVQTVVSADIEKERPRRGSPAGPAREMKRPTIEKIVGDQLIDGIVRDAKPNASTCGYDHRPAQSRCQPSDIQTPPTSRPTQRLDSALGRKDPNDAPSSTLESRSEHEDQHPSIRDNTTCQPPPRSRHRPVDAEEVTSVGFDGRGGHNGNAVRRER